MHLILRILLAGLTAAAAAAPALAQDAWPTRPITILVGFTPGGGSDTAARTLAPALAAEFKVPVIVDNKAGAGGVIATDMVAKAKPDGYTLLLASPGAFTIASALRKLPYDPVEDFTPLAQLTYYPNILVASAQSGIQSVADLVRKAKEAPGKIDYASTGIGATPHLAVAYLGMLTGTSLNHVPYKGNPPAIADLLGGQVSLLVGDPPPLLAHVHSGKLKALAVTTKERSRLFPDIPSMTEAGVPGYDVPFWHALVGPKGLPADIRTRIDAALRKVMARKDVNDTILAAGMELRYRDAAELTKLMADERARWAAVIRSNNIKE